MEFTIKLDRFEGPYTKLIELIDEKKLSITEVSLVSVADEYLAYIKTLGEKNMVDLSQFILVASTLMLMKAKSLLPGVTYTEEEEKQVHDLEYKLELHALLLQGVKCIQGAYLSSPLYSREHTKYGGNPVFVPDTRVTTATLQSIAELTLASFVTPKVLVKVAVESALRIEHVIEQLLKRVTSMTSLSLKSLAEGAASFEEKKKLLIVHFIALLELVRSGAISAEQSPDGGDIELMKR